MMRNAGIHFSVDIDKQALLTVLKSNREGHANMVAEARAKYVEQAKDRIYVKLEELKQGKVVALSFGLTAPLDYTEAYDVAISMLGDHTGQTVQLSADEYRHLVQDLWDWSDTWARVNAQYSISTRAYAVSKNMNLGE